MRFESLVKQSSSLVIRVLLIVVNLILAGISQYALAQGVPPALEFPQAGLDDTSTYRGYTTRFFRDSAGNTLQIYIDQNNGRLVHLWADAANESMAFTARDTAGQPAKLTWDSPGATLFSQGKARYLQYTLSSQTSALDVGLFLLGSMRKERSFQYQQRHLLAFGAEPFLEAELVELIDDLEQLPEAVRHRHLALLNAQDPTALHARLVPKITVRQEESRIIVLVQQPTFDGKNRLSLELRADGTEVSVRVLKDKIALRSRRRQPLQLTIKVGTDSPALHPLRREDIFNRDFFRFYDQVKAEHDSLLLSAGTARKDERLLRFKRLERQVESMELMSAQEKLMAGLPNYATYFGRDVMMSALMMEPIWSPAMLEHVIASVLRKLNAAGEVSHEEALGGQAIRENAAGYNQVIEEYFESSNREDNPPADSLLARAEKILASLQAVREDYRMVDDDFQLPVLAARYLARGDVLPDRKRDFLLQNATGSKTETRLALLLRNLSHLERTTAPYVANPQAANLVSFPKRDERHWFSGSWRDSDPGYANGRFAMDINAAWAPKALEAMQTVFFTLRELGFTPEELERMSPKNRNTKLSQYARDPESLRQAITLWHGAKKHFQVNLGPQEAEQRIDAKLNWLAEAERVYWERILLQTEAAKNGVEFLALSLDANGKPIPVANTDPATLLFLENFTGEILDGEATAAEVFALVNIFVLPYPAGLFVEDLGPLAANDAYGSREIWESFKTDYYHSPRTVWGREVNLMLLGLAKQILAAHDDHGRLQSPMLAAYVPELREALNLIATAVEASGLKHNELWSYRIVGDELLPARYPTTTDIQLWNLTDLAVQYLLDRISDL